MIRIKHKGNFNNTDRFFQKAILANHRAIFEKYGRAGVQLLSAATPVDTGETAASWGYSIIEDRRGTKLVWTNSNTVDGYSIAILLQYGHGTGNGGYVQGRDFINPVMRPTFDSLASELWREVCGL